MDTIDPLSEIQQQQPVKSSSMEEMDKKIETNNNNNSWERAIKSTNSSDLIDKSQQQQPSQQFATIELSANHHVLQVNNNNNGGGSGDKVNDTNIVAGSSNSLKSNHHSSNHNPKSGFSNGDIIVTLYPLNDNCAWLTPATFKAHLVPEELMAQPLTLTVEDYVSTMSILLSDYRFHLYITLHKRILAIWLTLSIIILLGILASSTKGLSVFLSGIFWLILNALGIFLVIFIKSRLYRMLEECIAQVNTIFGRHNIFLGIDDRGHFSCHKINLIFVYFDTKYCIKFLQDMLKNNDNNKTIQQNNRQTTTIDTSILNDDETFVDNGDNIYITGSNGTRQISQKEKQAEKLLFRYSQRWIREYGRQRMSLSIIQPQPEQQQQQQSQPPIQQQQPQQSNNTDQPITLAIQTDIPPRHCRQAKCFCQYIEEMYRGKQQQHQQQQQSFGNFCLTSLMPCISTNSRFIPSCCR
ncbi:hypothetical protein DERP_010122 [Dermatophagoides pteronyssinus]|uniref:Uncharacterized protein n=1 Tax=Dermatophagoides pteronyssinus TaxID=6956 RepID=A0ABQ8JFR6_DERPT|nr:hypothetical protein DERP_010122 [Dermatophagoides pteronyssinus]